MKYIKQGSLYMFKNFWYVMLLWILPAVFFGLCVNPFQLLQFINLYPSTVITNFSNIFQILMPFSWAKIVLAILGVLLVSVFLSLALGEIESHMRSGKLHFKNMFAFVNNNILVVLINVILLAILYFVLVFLLGSVLFLLHLMLSGLSNVPTILNVVIAVILCVAILILFVVFTMNFLLNIPNMISNGYSLKEGISSTLSLISKNTFKLLCAYLLPFAIIIPAVCLLSKTNAMWTINMFGSLLIGCYYSCLTMTSYFELSSTSRYDDRKYYNYNK